MKYRIKKFTAYEIINLKAEQTIVTFYNKEKILFAPLLKVDGTLLITTKKAILESDEDIKLVPLSFFQSIKFILKLFTKKRRKNALVYDSIYVTFREKKQKKLFFKINNHFANYSINLENRELRENLEIVKGISNKAITFKKSERAKIAIVIHIYFKTTMSDFIPIINNNVGIDVIITTPILDLESHIT